MERKKLDVKIKQIVKENDSGSQSVSYDLKINGRDFNRGVTNVKLVMRASDLPRLTIECVPDNIDFELDTDKILKLSAESKEKLKNVKEFINDFLDE